MAKFLTIYLIRHARQSSALCNVNVPLAKEGRTAWTEIKAYGN